MPSDTRAKVVVITGGERGIGRGIAEFFAHRDWSVVVAGIEESSWKPLKQASFFRCDVSEEQDVKLLFQHVSKEFGKLDGLVLNAGIADPERKSIESLDRAEWDKVISVNLTGAFLCLKQAAKLLKDSRGSVVGIASTRASMSEANTFAYTASKGGLVSLMHSAAISLGPEVRANTVSPGWIHNGNVSELREIDHRQHPSGRVGVPRDIAEIVFYLLGEGSGFITGQEFVVDGGMTKKMLYEH